MIFTLDQPPHFTFEDSEVQIGQISGRSRARSQDFCYLISRIFTVFPASDRGRCLKHCQHRLGGSSIQWLSKTSQEIPWWFLFAELNWIHGWLSLHYCIFINELVGLNSVLSNSLKCSRNALSDWDSSFENSGLRAPQGAGQFDDAVCSDNPSLPWHWHWKDVGINNTPYIHVVTCGSALIRVVIFTAIWGTVVFFCFFFLLKL